MKRRAAHGVSASRDRLLRARLLHFSLIPTAAIESAPRESHARAASRHSSPPRSASPTFHRPGTRHHRGRPTPPSVPFAHAAETASRRRAIRVRPDRAPAGDNPHSNRREGARNRIAPGARRDLKRPCAGTRNPATRDGHRSGSPNRDATHRRCGRAVGREHVYSLRRDRTAEGEARQQGCRIRFPGRFAGTEGAVDE